MQKIQDIINEQKQLNKGLYEELELISIIPSEGKAMLSLKSLFEEQHDFILEVQSSRKSKSFTMNINEESNRGNETLNAIDLYTKEINENPNSDNVYRNRANYYYIIGDYINSLNDINEAIHLSANMYENYYIRSLIYNKLWENEPDFDKMIEYMHFQEVELMKSLEINSNSDKMKKALEELHQHKKRIIQEREEKEKTLLLLS
jgi:tetratricopeptide (TPR) repeat protein